MGKTILVVDDDAMNLRMAEMILKKSGYEVKKADSGQAALALLKEEAVDLILLDVEMPVMSGIETLDAIRARGELAEIPIAFLSASEDMEQSVANGEYAVQGFISKPILPPKLYESVAALLQ
ncbi:MAG: response regulator [Lachnospiraceae bacterium]|nr:response regulator [Lachnospiraceae bacterium]